MDVFPSPKSQSQFINGLVELLLSLKTKFAGTQPFCVVVLISTLTSSI
jgi:hypothetical protein